MKIKFKILGPQRPDQSGGYDTIINYDPDGASSKRDVNAKLLYDTFAPFGYFTPATGSGFDFEVIFKKFGINVREYAQVSSYSVTRISARIIEKEAQKYSSVVQCLYPQGSLDDYFKGKGRRAEIYVYEWIPKSRVGKAIILFGPKEEEQELNLMYTKTLHTETIELPNEEALSYFTSRSIFVMKKSELKEELGSFLGDSMTPEFRDAIENFKEGQQFGMWGIGSIEDRFDFNPDDFPWAKKVTEVQKQIGDIIEQTGSCLFRKYAKVKKILKSL